MRFGLNLKFIVLFLCWVLLASLAVMIVRLDGQGRLGRQGWQGYFYTKRQEAKTRYKIQSLNFYMPHTYDDLYRNMVQGGAVDDSYPAYFKLVAQYQPQLAEGHALLGYCLYRSGHMEEAIASYEKAIALNPHYFWSWYDLGLIYYQLGDFDKAAVFLQQALKAPPEATLQALTASKLYSDILTSTAFSAFNAVDHLRQGYARAQVILFLAIAKQSQSIPPGEISFF